MSDMIYRAEDDEDDQAHIPYTTLWDHRLSVRARGLLAMLLCLRPGSGVSMVDLAREMRQIGGQVVEGRDALRAARRELESAGYLVSTSERGERGRWVTRTRVYRRPRFAVVPATDANPQVRPGTENPAPARPAPENPARHANPQVRPGTENPAPAGPAPENPALSSSTEGGRGDEDARTRVIDQHVGNRAGAAEDPLAGWPVLQGLERALTDAGVDVAWSVDLATRDRIEALVASRGVERMVRAALRQQAAVPVPAEYVSAFVRRWAGLRPQSPRAAARDAAAPPAPAGEVPTAGGGLESFELAELAELESRLAVDGVPRIEIKIAREQLEAEGYPVGQVPVQQYRLATLRRAAELVYRTPA